MPLYDFKCMTCNEVIETSENIPPVCSTCSGTMQRIWSAPAIKFNAPGFYSTGG
jgi:putative FmdB family regulatory protein